MPNNALALVRNASIALLATLSLGACATRQYVDEQIAGSNSRVEAVDQRVQSAVQRSEAAATEARTANQRIDQLEGRVNRLEQAPVRRPRG